MNRRQSRRGRKSLLGKPDSRVSGSHLRASNPPGSASGQGLRVTASWHCHVRPPDCRRSTDDIRPGHGRDGRTSLPCTRPPSRQRGCRIRFRQMSSAQPSTPRHRIAARPTPAQPRSHTTRQSRRSQNGADYASPFSTGRDGSLIQPLQDGANGREPCSPACSIASRFWHAVTPEPHMCAT